VADAMREESLRGGVGRREQYVTIYAGMRTEAYLTPARPRETVRAELGLKEDDIAVGTVARLFYLKGHEDLLALAPRLCGEFPRLKFLWVGDGLLRGEFERQIAQMGLGERFVLTGLVPPARIPELANAMDVLVHPSRREGLALALAQAQLAGRPVVTYDVDGNREGLIDGKTGFLVAPFDRERLAECLQTLLGDDALRRTMGQAGRAFAAGRFGAEAMVDALEKLYEEAAAKSGV
jgi:glycosyltransferase involved in cell wall biosynthesis